MASAERHIAAHFYPIIRAIRTAPASIAAHEGGFHVVSSHEFHPDELIMEGAATKVVPLTDPRPARGEARLTDNPYVTTTSKSGQD
ncbi:hypothetical protein acdb102_25010 [Acidothermaceae bacterium B102]|nr:hypothetical protein acdb102_25010 [Acidothermaceae bacterium B102]